MSTSANTNRTAPANRMGGSPWIVRPQARDGVRLRLLCFPYAGGGPSVFRTWRNRMPEGVECCLVQPPGKESRVLEEPVRSIDEIVEAIHEALQPMLDLPFVFFGHSMGGKVSFELARLLRRKGERVPSALVISATRAPTVPDPDPPVRHLPDKEFVEEIQKRYDAIPSGVMENEELLELIMPGLRADFEAMETHLHREEEPLACPIICMGGEGDDRVGEAGLRAWQAETTSELEITIFPGDHFYIQSHEDRVVPFLAQRVEKILERCP